MNKSELERRTKTFAVGVIQFVANLPVNKAADVVGYQLTKSGTAIGANYREANRAESRKDCIHKIGIVEKEASETQYWLELLEECNIGSLPDRQLLLRECNELLAIFTAIGKTAKNNLRKAKSETDKANSKSQIRISRFAIRNPKF